MGVREVIKKSNDTLITPTTISRQRWGKHFRRQFIWPTATMGLPFMPVGEPMQVDTSLLSEVDTIREIGMLKRQGSRTRWTVDILLQGWRRSINTKSKNLAINLAREEIPKVRCESVIVRNYKKVDGPSRGNQRYQFSEHYIQTARRHYPSSTTRYSRKGCMNRVGFRTSLGCIRQISVLQ